MIQRSVLGMGQYSGPRKTEESTFATNHQQSFNHPPAHHHHMIVGNDNTEEHQMYGFKQNDVSIHEVFKFSPYELPQQMSEPRMHSLL